jgi:hypothetical protein
MNSNSSFSLPSALQAKPRVIRNFSFFLPAICFVASPRSGGALQNNTKCSLMVWMRKKNHTHWKQAGFIKIPSIPKCVLLHKLLDPFSFDFDHCKVDLCGLTVPPKFLNFVSFAKLRHPSLSEEAFFFWDWEHFFKSFSLFSQHWATNSFLLLFHVPYPEN